MTASSRSVLEEAVSALRALALDPADGLPQSLFRYVSGITPLVNVDLLIRDDTGRTLLTWRDDENYGHGWHIPGGIVRYGETFMNRVQAVARDELGASVAADGEPLAINQVIDRARKERGHFVSLLYRCQLTTPPDAARRAPADVPLPGQWRWHGSAPDDLLPVQDFYRPYFASASPRRGHATI